MIQNDADIIGFDLKNGLLLFNNYLSESHFQMERYHFFILTAITCLLYFRPRDVKVALRRMQSAIIFYLPCAKSNQINAEMHAKLHQIVVSVKPAHPFPPRAIKPAVYFTRTALKHAFEITPSTANPRLSFPPNGRVSACFHAKESRAMQKAMQIPRWC